MRRPDAPADLTSWQLWRDHPEKVRARRVLFQIHLWVGTIVSAYILIMSVSGGIIVYRNQLFRAGISAERLVSLHSTLWAGHSGRLINGLGAASLVVLCFTGAVIWWPGTSHWRRSLMVDWRANPGRINWDLHSAVGFWWFAFVFLWGVSGLYLALPDQFSTAFFLDPASSVTARLADLHFGRFNAVTQVIWSVIGLVPAILSFTGTFICCRRVIFKRPSSPKISIP